MRILHVINHTERLNGHVYAAADLACAQAKLGHQVTVASAGGSMDALLVANSVEIVRVDQRRRPLIVAAAVVKLTQLIRRHRFEVVHAHMMTSALLCWPACKVNGVPLVTTVHNEFERSAIAMRVGQRVICVSGAVARSMVRRGVPATRVRTVLNGTIGTARYAGLPGSPMALGPASILFVGGLHPRKGFPDLLEAFHSVVASVPGATLHIVGEGPCAAEYKAAAAAGPFAGAITFYGGIDDPRPWYLGAAVFVLPSRAEPAGLVLSEACEAGCAIVASDVGGIPEMLDGGRAGVLVPPENPARLAAALTKLLIDPVSLQQAKSLARANVTRMSLARVTQETLDVYRDMHTSEGLVKHNGKNMSNVAQSVFLRVVSAMDVLQRVYMRLVTYLSPVKDCQTVFGATMHCNSRDFVQRRIRFFGVFEHNLTYYTITQLRPGDTYVDIGANVGYYSLLASQLVGSSGKVISVEAAPTTFAKLEKNLQTNRCTNVTALNVAATAERCKVSIEVRDPHNSGASGVRIDPGSGSVDGLPFRDIVGNDIGRVRFIKIDIEDSETPILQSILDALPDLPQDVTIASEMSTASAGLVARFVAAGFRAFAIQNAYPIDYYLIRSYLRKYQEDKSVHKVPVTTFDPAYRDYVFESGPSPRP